MRRAAAIPLTLFLVFLPGQRANAEQPFSTVHSSRVSEAVREFGARPFQLTSSGYAEVVMISWVKGSGPTEYRNRIWFRGSAKYRIESWTSVGSVPGKDLWTYAINDGRHIFSTMCPTDRARRAKWSVVPSSWMPGLLETSLLRHVSVTDAHLVGKEKLLGLRAEHWRGRIVGKYGSRTVDVWVSAEPHFPLVLRCEIRTQDRSSVWEISKLRLQDVPNYVFTAQIQPRGGLKAMLALPYKPWPLLLLFQVALLVCFAGIVSGLAPPSAKTNLRRRWVLAVCCGLALPALMRAGSGTGAYLGQFADTPVILAMAAACAGFAALVWRRVGPPGDVGFFRHMRWTAVLYVLLTAFLAFAWQYWYYHALASGFVQGWKLPFLPALLVNVVLLSASLAAVEEIVFRGYLFHAIYRRLTAAWLAVLIQAVVFGIYHIPKYAGAQIVPGHIILTVLVLIAMGAVLGYLRLRCRNLCAPWLVHLTYNTALLYVYYASQLGLMHAISDI